MMGTFSDIDEAELMMALINKNNGSCNFRGLLLLIDGGFYSKDSFRKVFTDLQERKIVRLTGTIIDNPGDGSGAKEGPSIELNLHPEAKLEQLQYFDQDGNWIKSEFNRYGRKLYPPNDMPFTIQFNKRVEMVR